MTIWNHQTIVLSQGYEGLKDFVLSLPERFKKGDGKVIHNMRNQVRCIDYDGAVYVVKSFKRPNVINRWVYGVFRRSKAERAYCNAMLYEKAGVGTPKPIGYLNIRNGLAFGQSYFVTLKSSCPWRYEDLFTHKLPYADEVLAEVGRITGILHDHGMVHKDYGRANILFEKNSKGKIRLDIVDLNRMAFGKVDIKQGCKNFERLPATPHMQRIMADAYARERGFDAEECYRLIRKYRSTQLELIDGELV